MMAEVHSSLSSIGHVVGGADTLIRALMDAVGLDGGIAMPAFRISPPVPSDALELAQGITMKLKILPEDKQQRLSEHY